MYKHKLKSAVFEQVLFLLQREVDYKGELTAVANLEKLAFRA